MGKIYNAKNTNFVHGSLIYWLPQPEKYWLKQKKNSVFTEKDMSRLLIYAPDNKFLIQNPNLGD